MFVTVVFLLDHEYRDCCTVERASRLAGPDHVISAGVFSLRHVLCDDLGDSVIIALTRKEFAITIQRERPDQLRRRIKVRRCIA